MSETLPNEGTDNEFGFECFTALDLIEIDPRSLLEVEDPKHRYGKNLRHYYREWENSESFDSKYYGDNKIFFAWLDSPESPNVITLHFVIYFFPCINFETISLVTLLLSASS